MGENKMASIKDYVDFHKVNVCCTNSMCRSGGLPAEELIKRCEATISKPINYHSTTLMNIAKKYNDLYMAFLNDFNSIPEKIELGVEMDVLSYNEFYKKETNTLNRSVRLFIYENNILKGNNDSAYLTIREADGELKLRVHNDYNKSVWDKDYFSFTPSINEETARAYLDLFQKHQEFVKMYFTLRHLGLHSGCYIMSTYITEEFNLTEGMKQLEICGTFFNLKGLVFRMPFVIGENFDIDYKHCKFLDGHDTNLKLSDSDIHEFATRVRVNNSYLRPKDNR